MQNIILVIQSVCVLVAQFSSVAQSCLTFCDPMNLSTPGFPVHHQLQELTQTHAHQVSDAIQPSRPLSSPFPPVPNPSQYQGLFQCVNSSHEVAKVLEFHVLYIYTHIHTYKYIYIIFCDLCFFVYYP